MAVFALMFFVMFRDDGGKGVVSSEL